MTAREAKANGIVHGIDLDDRINSEVAHLKELLQLRIEGLEKCMIIHTNSIKEANTIAAVALKEQVLREQQAKYVDRAEYLEAHRDVARKIAEVNVDLSGIQGKAAKTDLIWPLAISAVGVIISAIAILH